MSGRAEDRITAVGIILGRTAYSPDPLSRDLKSVSQIRRVVSCDFVNG